MAETVLPPKIVDGTVTLTFSFTWDSVVIATGAYFGYCTINDVKFEFANVGGFTTLSATNVAMEIAYAAIELQEAIIFAYAMPYGGSNQSVLIKLREMNAKLAFARLVERYFTANEPNHTEAAEIKTGWVNHQVEQILNGHIRWDPPFGDAIKTARLPVFSKAAAASVTPSPGAGDSSALPIFTLTSPGTRNNGGSHM